MAYIRAANPIWYMVDHTGESLNDEYYAFFLSDTFPYVPQAPFRDPAGATVWTGGIVQFQPSGTLPNNLYFDDTKTYRIEIRRGNTQADTLIWEINNFVPATGTNNNTPNLVLTSDNQVSNPQFAYVSFNETCSITSAGDYEIAPGWYLELAGAGSADLTQLRNLAGIDNIPGNPSYALRIVLSGWTTAYLRQRFAQNGSLFAGTSWIDPSGITMSVTALSNDNIPHELKLSYRQEGATAIPVVQQNLDINDYTVLDGAKQLTLSTNATSNPDSYTDMLVVLPTGSSDITITNLQAIGEFNEDEPVALAYEQEPVERQLDHLFHYYSDSLLRQPKQSILTGWDFALNPWQYRTTAQTNLANNDYTADQTIVIQQKYVTDATANNISVGRGSAANNYAFKVTAVTANSQFAILQYIAPQTIRPYWGKKLSAFVKARISTTNATNVRYKMRLIYRTDAVPTVSQNEPVTSWAASGEPIFTGGWTSIAPLNDPIYTLTSTTSGVSFNQFILPAAATDNNVLGIILYTLDPLTETGTPDSVYFERITLTQNDFAIDSLETYDEALRKCQFYYEKSYQVGDLPGAVTGIGLKEVMIQGISDGSSTNVPITRFSVNYCQTKRAAPSTINIYSPDGTAGNIQIGVVTVANASISAATNRALTQWTIDQTSTDRFSYVTNNTGTNIYTVGSSHTNYLGYMRFHYTADARLGV